MTSKANNFDFARLLAALAVLFSHSFTLYGVNEPVYLFTHGLTLGTLAVYAFFIMSGYLIAKSWIDDPRVHAFTMRRALRILPALYVFLIGSTILGIFLTTLSASEYFSAANIAVYLKQADVFDLQGVLPGVFAKNPLPIVFNGSLWSIRVEVACYAVAIVVGVLGILRSKTLSGGFAVLVLGAYLFAKHHETKLWLLNMEGVQAFDVGAYFFAASSLYVWRDKVRFYPLIGALSVAACFTVLKGETLLITLHFVLPYAILSLILSPIRFISGIGRHGDISYGVYIYAFPVQQTVIYFFRGHLSLSGFMALSAAGTIACAAASWFLVEKPMLKRKPGRRASLAETQDAASSPPAPSLAGT